MGGLSLINLKYCKLFFNYLAIRSQSGDELQLENSPRVEDQNILLANEYPFIDIQRNFIFQLPWGHIKVLIDKVKRWN